MSIAGDSLAIGSLMFETADMALLGRPFQPAETAPYAHQFAGDMMKNLLPVGQEFVMRNMQLLAHPHKGTQFFSLVMLLITSTGVFLPLEVALNRVWGVRQNRSYLHNQAVSLGLAFAASAAATAPPDRGRSCRSPRRGSHSAW